MTLFSSTLTYTIPTFCLENIHVHVYTLTLFYDNCQDKINKSMLSNMLNYVYFAISIKTLKIPKW